MKVINGKKPIRFLTSLLAAFAAIMACACMVVRFSPEIGGRSGMAALAAAGFIMPEGGAALARGEYQPPSSSQTTSGAAMPGEQTSSDISSSVSSSTSSSLNNTSSGGTSSISSSVQSHAPGEKTYPIWETMIGGSGTQFQNFWVKNETEKHKNLDIAAELAKKPDIKIKKNSTPQVLIVHTHTTEAFMGADEGFYYESFYPRSQDPTKNVVHVGDAIAAQLQKAGIGVIHDTTVHDYPSYNGSYSRSAQTIAKNLKQYPSIQVVLDIHRDALTASDGTKKKPTVKINGKKAAQIMIYAGCDDDGTLGFPGWEYNLRFALRLQQSVETLYPGLTRPLFFEGSKYNMNMTHGSLLIEIGTDANTVDEVAYSGELVGNALSQVLNQLTT